MIASHFWIFYDGIAKYFFHNLKVRRLHNCVFGQYCLPTCWKIVLEHTRGTFRSQFSWNSRPRKSLYYFKTAFYTSAVLFCIQQSVFANVFNILEHETDNAMFLSNIGFYLIPPDLVARHTHWVNSGSKRNFFYWLRSWSLTQGGHILQCTLCGNKIWVSNFTGTKVSEIGFRQNARKWELRSKNMFLFICSMVIPKNERNLHLQNIDLPFILYLLLGWRWFWIKLSCQ